MSSCCWAGPHGGTVSTAVILVTSLNTAAALHQEHLQHRFELFISVFACRDISKVRWFRGVCEHLINTNNLVPLFAIDLNYMYSTHNGPVAMVDGRADAFVMPRFGPGLLKL